MFLKKIQLFGFKSFSEKAEIELSRGITAIIGPNGCGKSNIADGVKWALGEQSTKNLRGSSMEDVIFNGTDQSKPLGFAEVSLVFDNIQRGINLDYTEVSITRRLFRSGESQYFINKSPCRLKEITELFHDTGIGKEAYSIISQGKIDQILSARPEDRRSVFEEAAGIYKYKNRKKEAERRLKETADNLQRVSDLIEELNQQLPSLGRQAEEAKSYLSCCERLKELEIGTLVNDINKVSREREKLQGKLETISRESQDKENSLSRLEAEVTREAFQRDKLEENIQEEKDKLERVREEKRATLGDIQLNQEKLKSIVSRGEQIKENIREVEENLQALEQRYTGFLASKKEIEDKTAQKREDLEGSRNKLEEISQKISSYHQEGERSFEDLRREIEEKGLSLRKLELEEGHLEERKAETRMKIEVDKEHLKMYLNQEKDLARDIDRHKSLLEQEQQQLSDWKGFHQKKEEQLEEFKVKVQAKEAELEKARMQVNLLKDMEEKGEGFSGAVKAILEAREKRVPFTQGVEGVVVNLLQVPPPYEKALDTALGFAAQQVVTRDENTAKEMISYLKRSRRGRATFLPLSLIDAPPPPKLNLEDKSIVGWALDLVTFDSKYRKVFNRLLGKVLVAKDLEGAVRVARSLNLKYKVVTLEGEVLFPGGAMTGGTSPRSKDSFISRKNSLHKLERQMDQHQKDLDLLQGEREKTRGEKERAEGEIRKALPKIENKEKELSKLNNQLNKIREDKKAINSRLQNLQKEKENYQEKIRDIGEAVKRHAREMKDMEEEKKRAREIFEEEKAKIQEIYQEKVNLERQVARMEAEVSSAERELSALLNNLSDLEEEKQNLSLKGAELQERKAKTRAEKEEGENIITAARGKAEELGKKESHLMEGLKGLQEEKDALYRQVMEKEQKIKNLRKNLQSREKKRHDGEVDLARLETELKNLTWRLEEEYGINLEEAFSYSLDTGEEKARQEIKILKGKKQGFGAVNTGAIEEYERLKERVDFLKEQREDLRKAKNTIHQVIGEIDEKMKVNFLRSFNQIKASFSNVFRDFFEGGGAYLKLNDPQNILDTGIDIVAQPPGKKLQGLSLLSGGEKALTAIALLFAILKVKPTPFCILDEIEVSLDSLNLNRFINYLKALTEDTQFIVITHRRKTMEAADVLYGVTMENPGVSKILSMKLPGKKEQRVS